MDEPNLASTIHRRALLQTAAVGAVGVFMPDIRLRGLQDSSVARWRADFPALAQQINGRPLAYLDSAATTLRPAVVIDAIADFYRTANANPSGTLRAVGARVLVDGAQSAPHIPVDVQALGCDFFVCSSHKMLGPMATGVAWGRRELLEAMPPYQTGSNMAHDVDFSSAVLEHDGQKFQAGTPNVSGPIGLAAACAYLDRLGRDTIAAHERALTSHALAVLKTVPGLKVIGPTTADNRVPVFCFTIDGVAVPAIVKALDDEGVAVRGGDMAALPLLQRFGTRAAARVSAYLYNTTAEIDRLGAILMRLPR